MGQTPIINRLKLILYLSSKYAHLGECPFVIKKDGKDFYVANNDYISFTCCPENHKHTMKVIDVLQLPNKYPIIPCPICNEQHRTVPSGGIKYNEAGDPNMYLFKSYLGGGDKSLNDPASAQMAIENFMKDEKQKIEEARRRKESENKSNIVRSIPLEEFKSEHPEYELPEIIPQSGANINDESTNVSPPKIDKNEEIEDKEEYKKRFFSSSQEHDSLPNEPDDLENEMSNLDDDISPINPEQNEVLTDFNNMDFDNFVPNESVYKENTEISPENNDEEDGDFKKG